MKLKFYLNEGNSILIKSAQFALFKIQKVNARRRAYRDLEGRGSLKASQPYCEHCTVLHDLTVLTENSPRKCFSLLGVLSVFRNLSVGLVGS